MRNTLRVVAAGCLSAVSFLAAPGAARAAGPEHVVVSQAFQSLLYLPLYVAIDQAMFKGLDVDMQTAGSPQAALSAVLSHSADFSIHGPEWAAIADSKGAHVAVIANVVNRAAVWIAASPSFKWTGVGGLVGQKVVTGMMPTTSTSLFLKLLKQKAIDANKLDMIQVQIGTEPGPFIAGQAPVAVMYEPGLDQAVAHGMKVVVSFPAEYGPYAFSSVIARDDEDATRAQLFVDGMQRALRYIVTDKAGTLKIAEKSFPGLDKAIVDAAVERMRVAHVWPDDVQTTAASLTTAMQTQITLGNLAKQPVYAAFIRQTYIKPALAVAP